MKATKVIEEKNSVEIKKNKSLSREDLSNIKGGGQWLYDASTNKWYWIENGE